MQVNDFISDFHNLPSIDPILQMRLNTQLSGGSAPVSLFIKYARQNFTMLTFFWDLSRLERCIRDTCLHYNGTPDWILIYSLR